MYGKVYFVGAGPGDTGLITVKGLEILMKADVVLYDRLVNPKILDYAMNAKEVLYVGKKVGEAHKQDWINKMLIEYAKKYKIVVRLKNGDPILFGRGGEEMEALREAGIEYEVIPGITSALAAPTYAGIPVTHRKYSSSLAILTGHRRESYESDLGIKDVLPCIDTAVILMGISNINEIVKEALESGISKDTPIAIIENATLPTQKVIISRLNKILDKIREYDVKPPAVIVIGKVVKLYEKLKWFK